mgnify:CR=1 FL=1
MQRPGVGVLVILKCENNVLLGKRKDLMVMASGLFPEDI